MRGTRTCSAPFVVLLLAACGSAPAPMGGEEGPGPIGNPDLISREEIQDARSARNAYDLVRNIRPQWLVTRGITNLRQAAGEEDIVVYLDNARLGYREALRRVTLAGVEYLEFFDARRATLRWGGGHIHGAILVSTNQRR